MKKKILLSLFLLIILLANITFASYSTVTMSVVKEPVCTIELGENSSFEKKLISKNLENKEVTLQLKVTNEETSIKPTGELVLVLDNSKSMETKLPTGKTRKEVIFESAKSLIANLLKDNNKLKIGIVDFSSNIDISKEGSTADASVTAPLTNDLTILTNAISNIKTDGPRTNLQAGIQLASKQFTTSTDNKYIIVLTDGVPNIAIDYNKKYYSDDVISKTKEELLDIEKNEIKIIQMLTGIDNEDYIPGTATKSYGQIISEIFGTSEKPTVGKFYYVTDEEVEKTITTDIYNTLVPIEKSFTDIIIKDYFPDEIIKNFDFAYVAEVNKGNISAKVDTKDNSITWTIPELASGETATVQYTLKLKKEFDSKIVNKILNTNKKVDITYKDFEGKEKNNTSDISPQLKLIEPEVKKPVEQPKEPDIAPKIIPKAGSATFVGFVALLIGFAGFSLYKLIDYKNKLK